MPETKLFIVRHGFNPANNVGYNNQEGIRENLCKYDEWMPLDKYGIAQAREVGDFLRENAFAKQTKGKVLVLVSPYYRTRQTAHEALSRVPADEKRGMEVKIAKQIREINQGLEYAETKAFGARLKEEYNESISRIDKEKANEEGFQQFTQGETTVDVRNRVRKFSKELESIAKSGQYDSIIVFSHDTLIKELYKLVAHEKLTEKINTGSIIELDFEDGKSVNVKRKVTEKIGADNTLIIEVTTIIFTPETSAPKGYEIHYSDFKNHKLLQQMQESIELLKGSDAFNSFWGDRQTLFPLECNCEFTKKAGEIVVRLPHDKGNRAFYYIDAQIGQDRILKNNKRDTSFLVLSGKGKICYKTDMEDEYQERVVKQGDEVLIEAGMLYYYESLGNPRDPKQSLRMLKKIPKTREEKVEDFGPAPRFKGKAELDSNEDIER